MRPSDIPYPPDSPEGRAWTRQLIRWQTSPATNPDLPAVYAAADARIARMNAAHALTPAQLAVNATLREVAEARRPSPGSSWHTIQPGELILTPEQWKALTQTVKDVAEFLRTTLAAAFDLIKVALVPAVKAFDDWLLAFTGPPLRSPSPLLAAHRRRRHR